LSDKPQRQLHDGHDAEVGGKRSFDCVTAVPQERDEEKQAAAPLKVVGAPEAILS